MLLQINSKKGQSLVEFALLLPILLLLMLGIIEGARVMWAYITVQNAAKEAAHYAITGRPFYCEDTDPIDSPNFEDYCDDPIEGEAWATQVLTSTRVAAIKDVAERHGRILGIELLADKSMANYNYHKGINPEEELTPGAFGIAVIGQSFSYSGTNALGNYGGAPGWNVRIQTYYNVKMVDPIYDAIMGGTTIHLAGKVELENEGNDPDISGYVPGIPGDFDTTCSPNCDAGGSTAYIVVNDEDGDLSEPAGNSFTVLVRDHDASIAYDLVFTHIDGAGVFQEKATFTTDPNGDWALNFVINASAPPSPFEVKTYKIHTELSGGGAIAAHCNGKAEACFNVEPGDSFINAYNITDGDEIAQPETLLKPIWPYSSSIPLRLSGHTPGTDYTMGFDGQTAGPAPGYLAYDDNNNATKIPVESLGSNETFGYYVATGYDSPQDVMITSHETADVTADAIATTTVTLRKGYIEINADLQDPDEEYPAGDVLNVVLKDHAPRQRYQIFYEPQSGTGLTTSDIVRANSNGNIFTQYEISNGIHIPGKKPPVPVEIYTEDYGRGNNPNKIARRVVQIFTPIDPYIRTTGGSRWPAGSPVDIFLGQHEGETQYRVYLERGEPGSTTYRQWVDDLTLETSPEGTYKILGYRIPADLAGFYVLRSYKPISDPNEATAEYEIEITSNPYIEIEKGKRWPPGAKISILLKNHPVGQSYDVWLDRDLSEERKLGTVLVDSYGDGDLKYTIPETLPTKIEPGYPLYSYKEGRTVVVADNADLEISPADLIVTEVDIPSVIFDVEVPLTITIKNQSLVTVANTFFDTDLYVDPIVAPTSGGNSLPPGDFKQWRTDIFPGESLQLHETVVLYGQQVHQIYARVDTSDIVAESVPGEGNNILLKTIEGICGVTLDDEFSGDGLSEWSQTSFGSGGVTCPTLPDLSAPTAGGGSTVIAKITNGQLSNYDSQTADPNPPAFTSVGDTGDARFGVTGGGFTRVQLKDQKPNNSTSAGLSKTFTLGSASNVTFSFRYYLRLRALESTEWGELHVCVDADCHQLIAANGNGGWNQNSGWQAETFSKSLGAGSHSITFVAYSSRRNQNDEWMLGFFDDLEATGIPTTLPAMTAPSDPGGTNFKFHADYGSGVDSFSYAGDTFRSTSGTGSHGEGNRVTDTGAWGVGDSALQVRLGAIGSTTADPISGGWSRDLTITAEECVTIRGFYRVNFPYNEYASDEYGDVLLSLENVGGTAFAVEKSLSGQLNASDGGSTDSGWVAFNITIPNMVTGTYKLTLGGFNNKASGSSAVTQIWFDNVYVVSNAPSGTAGTQSESAGILVMDNQGSSATTADDNGSGAGYHFMHRTIGEGAFEVYVRLDQQPSNSTGFAGLEIRANEDSGSSDKIMFVHRGDKKLRVYTRSSGGSASSVRNSNDVSGPVWMKIARNGNEFKFYRVLSSSDTPPENWGTVWHVESGFTMPAAVEVGLINAPATSGSSDVAHFDHFHICAATAPGSSSGGSGGQQGYLGSRCGEVEEAGIGLVVLDAVNVVDPLASAAGSLWTSVIENNVLGTASMEGLEATPGTITDLAVGTGSHARYQASFQTAGTYYVWVAGLAADGSHNEVHIGLNDEGISTPSAQRGVVTGLPVTSGSDGANTNWVKMSTTFSIDAASNSIDLWVKDGDVKIFKILLTTDPAFKPPGESGEGESMSQSACSIIVQEPYPPNYQECVSPLAQGDFEGTQAEVNAKWTSKGRNYNYRGASAQTGRYGALMLSGGNIAPAMYQSFVMPAWLLSDTSAKLNVASRVSGSDVSFEVFFSLRRATDKFELTTPISLGKGGDLGGWVVLAEHDIWGGVNPLAFVEPGDEVLAYFYAAKDGDGATYVDLDNISLEICTHQAAPTQESGNAFIGGTVYRSAAPYPGAKVWAYAVETATSNPGAVFETFAIQGGSYSFYNLPPGEYLVYAQLNDGSGTLSNSVYQTVKAGQQVKNLSLLVQ